MELIVELRLRSVAYDLVSLDRALDLEHDAGVNRGETPAHARRATEVTTWKLVERGTEEDGFDALLARLMERVAGREPQFASLVRSESASSQVWFVAYLEHDDRWPGLSLGEDSLRTLMELRADIEVDVYVLHD